MPCRRPLCRFRSPRLTGWTPLAAPRASTATSGCARASLPTTALPAPASWRRSSGSRLRRSPSSGCASSSPRRPQPAPARPIARRTARGSASSRPLRSQLRTARQPLPSRPRLWQWSAWSSAPSPRRRPRRRRPRPRPPRTSPLRSRAQSHARQLPQRLHVERWLATWACRRAQGTGLTPYVRMDKRSFRWNRMKLPQASVRCSKFAGRSFPEASWLWHSEPGGYRLAAETAACTPQP
mmetsp:Transcript_90648/g.234033  ORF Transcript_90648/g.234033 Transcript_90648/m.234033 type:complete len:238 (-) Transcript_90648:102-815(-)